MTTASKLALHTLSLECTVSSGTIEPSTQGGSMARRRYQCGCVILKGQVWYGKYRDDVVARPSSRYSLAWCSRDRPPSVAVFYSAAVPGDPLLAITVRCRWPRLSPPLPQSVHV